MENKNIIILIILLAIGAFYFWGPLKNKATTVQVSTFYDGQDGYSVPIPSGNQSTCIWTWVGGNAAIPDSRTTYANTATQKHTITFSPGSTYNYKVSCVDDFGNQYTGVFPAE